MGEIEIEFFFMKKQIEYSKIKEALARNNIFMVNPLEEMASLTYEQWEMLSPLVLEYIPIKIVACFEEYFRQLYAEIIDLPQFRENLKETIKRAKYNLDVDFLSDMTEDSVSMGDYLSFHFPCNKLDDIIGTLSSLLTKDYLKLLKERLMFQCEDVGQVFDDVNKIFSYREICCHEHFTVNGLSVSDIMDYVQSANSLIYATNIVVKQIEMGLEPNEEVDLNEYAKKKFKQADKELELLVHKLMTLLGDDGFEHFGYIDSWKTYRELRAKYEANGFEESELFGFFKNSSMEDITKELIRTLRNKYKNILKSS